MCENDYICVSVEECGCTSVCVVEGADVSGVRIREGFPEAAFRMRPENN